MNTNNWVRFGTGKDFKAGLENIYIYTQASQNKMKRTFT